MLKAIRQNHKISTTPVIHRATSTRGASWLAGANAYLAKPFNETTVTAVELTQRFPDSIARMVANDRQEAQAIASYLEAQAAGHAGVTAVVAHDQLNGRADQSAGGVQSANGGLDRLQR